MTGRDILNVGIYQPRARDETPEDRLGRLAEIFTQPAARGCDLMICPELYMSGYLVHDRIIERAEPRDGPFARRACEIAKRANCAIVYGYPERDGDNIYNSALCAGAGGDALANHRKNLLPYDYEERYFRQGRAPTIVDIHGWRIGLLVCYEVEFPEPVRYYAQTGCELVAVPTALTREWPTVARRVIPARAFENNIFVAYANHAGDEQGNHYLGESVITSPMGEDLARGGADESVITARLDRAAIAAARARLRFLTDLKRSCYR